ncbi:hypothetical protein PICMEDRAFT_74790 [Pichia membranifaciens NRRL Y-2026]|uniref:Transcriptional regulator n=1 Tax=Pichia membranifaciens NRRL Y-2026 TaxID=763406 RepID=A0A1E3NDI1_9ASCO|nr:hypothetical protein PICMEDRAFT_74790 [Pichia membranifaciens NRRL Y-2026]ODQ44180.1 hypothetical protein PICMEDRAFT_74790 [Pichia membranifaciens NRRL Y-2026]
MYIPAKYLEKDWAVQEELIRSNPLGTIITYGEDGLVANHIPFFLSVDEETGVKYLQAHVAKVNPQLPALKKEGTEILVIFKASDSYITPSYYATKEETHKVVPTWDFGAVHCYGKVRVIDDGEWVRKQLDHLTGQQEKNRTKSWAVDEAPKSYVDLLQKSICGIEIKITRIESKFKYEQKMKRQDIDGVIKGLALDNKHEVSKLVDKCNPTA